MRATGTAAAACAAPRGLHRTGTTTASASTLQARTARSACAKHPLPHAAARAHLLAQQTRTRRTPAPSCSLLASGCPLEAALSRRTHSAAHQRSAPPAPLPPGASPGVLPAKRAGKLRCLTYCWLSLPAEARTSPPEFFQTRGPPVTRPMLSQTGGEKSKTKP